MLSKSWNAVESELLEYYQNDRGSLSEEAEQFLDVIGFVNDGGISENGRDYLKSKYIREDEYHRELLRSRVLDIKSVRELCQTFYGQQTRRENVEIFLRGESGLEDDSEIGRILILLNLLDIVDYSKRDGTIRFGQHEQIEEQGQYSYRITNRTPYSNIKRLRRCLRECEGTIRWIDKHFSKKGLEPLSDELAGDDIGKIEILCGTSNVNVSMRNDFKRFKEEMGNRGIEASLRVITESELYHDLHDRWILSDAASWNVPPIDSLYQNQEAEIHSTKEDVPFEDWWGSARDILSEWNDIQKAIN